MKIGRRLTLQFSIIVGLIFISVLISVYLLASYNAQHIFYERLKERVIIISAVFFEKDELSKERVHLFEEKFQLKLPFENIEIYDQNRKPILPANKNRLAISNAIFNTILLNGEIRYSEDGRQYFGIYYEDNQGKFFIVASAIDVTGKTKLRFLLGVCISLYVISLLIIYFFGKYFSRNAINPIVDVVNQVKGIRYSNLNVRVSGGKNKDEIQDLASTFNNMLERLEKSFKLERNFVSNASHELRTPLTSIIGELQVALSKDRDNDQLVATLRTILDKSIQMKELVNSLLLLTRAEEYTNPADPRFHDDIRIDELLLELKQNTNTKYASRPVQLHVGNLPEVSSQLIIKGNKVLLYSAFNNIIENAIKFSDEKLVICTLNYDEKNIKIEIIDTGIGIDDNDLLSVSYPFYRSENAREYKGYGVGLSISQTIIEKHNGTLKIASKKNVGTTVTIEFMFLD